MAALQETILADSNELIERHIRRGGSLLAVLHANFSGSTPSMPKVPPRYEPPSDAPSTACVSKSMLSRNPQTSRPARSSSEVGIFFKERKEERPSAN
jgi:hypothetical protein